MVFCAPTSDGGTVLTLKTNSSTPSVFPGQISFITKMCRISTIFMWPVFYPCIQIEDFTGRLTTLARLRYQIGAIWYNLGFGTRKLPLWHNRSDPLLHSRPRPLLGNSNCKRPFRLPYKGRPTRFLPLSLGTKLEVTLKDITVKKKWARGWWRDEEVENVTVAGCWNPQPHPLSRFPIGWGVILSDIVDFGWTCFSLVLSPIVSGNLPSQPSQNKNVVWSSIEYTAKKRYFEVKSISWKSLRENRFPFLSFKSS